MRCAAGRRFSRLARIRIDVFAAGAALLILPCLAAGEICVGDCDGDGTVAINELITGVDIALGSQVLGRCPLFDATGDGAMTIDECLRGVNNALYGCPPSGTATATITATATGTASPTRSATPVDTATATTTPTVTSTHSATATNTTLDTPTPTPTGTSTPTTTPTQTPTGTEGPASTLTVEATETRAPTLGATSTSTATVTPTPTGTPLWTAVPTSAGPSPTPDPLSDSCAAENQDVPLVARKVAAQSLRWLRDWATCLARSGYVGAACEVRLGRGANDATVLRQTGKPLVNEIVCNESRCTQDLGRSLDHCQEKFTYEDKCSLDDWDKIWRWVGDPPLMISGRCSTPAATACLVDADCGDGGTCLKPSSCDVYRYAPRGWEPCRCIQEVFIKPQIDEWLADVRGLIPAPTSDCAAAAFNTMGEATGFMIDSACMDPTDRSCLAALDMCEAQWSAIALKNSCGTCSLGADDGCPSSCDGAQIDCTTWMSWCASAKARFAPLRTGTRQLPSEP